MSVVNSPLSQPQRPNPVIGPDRITFALYWFQWLQELVTKVNAVFIGSAGQATLVAGVALVPLSGLTSANLAMVSLAKGIGTLALYQGVCTDGLLTITSLNTDLSTQTADLSVVNYVIFSETG